MFWDKVAVFSEMFSLLFQAPKEASNLITPNISSDENPEIEEFEKKESGSTTFRSRYKKLIKMRVTACPHINKPHYAKNMCSSCYHRAVRQTKAWICPHEDRQHYAKGMCQFCYLQNYHKSRPRKI
ncbi:unnamed protein product [Blepharisma stoltei]|uniref:Uncharacterized protein n=1 Tax=Blepharisma stoltei TaxID=1481888 RepID=A0AAU9K7K2_9CILI|nr:unnamed protein product [Blepharisma stoltei]